MLRRLATFAAAATLAAPAAAQAAPTPCKQGASAVTDSFDTALNAIKEDRTAPPRAARTLAALAVSMDSALDATAAAGDCTTAATAVRAAAAPVIVELLWATEAAKRERARINRLGGNAAGRDASPAARRGAGPAARRGASAARRTLARIAKDRLNPDVAIVVPRGLEKWEPAYPDYMGPTDASAPSWRPWNIADITRVRPPKPPAGAALTAETLAVWRAVNEATPEQQAKALFWADGAGTVTPAGHWTQIALDVLTPSRTSGGRLAHDMATLETAQADAFIACWDAKYAYWLARPVTLVQRFDPNWRPMLSTPPFPSYVSGHASTSAAAATVLAKLVPSKREELERQADEAASSRVWSGIHFPIDSTEGMRLGRKVAQLALKRRAGT